MQHTYRINEIFGPTIQGEGFFIGQPVLFIRFSGCNLKCPFCDTDYKEKGHLDVNGILQALKKLSQNVMTVVLTGGEPLLQTDEPLLNALNINGYKVHVETNGTINTNLPFSHVVCSPKNIDKIKLHRCDDLKILIPYLFDFTRLNIEYTRLFIQPIEGKITYEKILPELIKHKATLSPQLHKLIGVK